jgi:pimeloyl-ACP methyl ester carboxylesterase
MAQTVIREGDLGPYGGDTLGAGIRSRRLPNVNGLDVHFLEAGFEEPGRPALLLLHGFPEIAYSWRKVIGPLAAAGYHVIAPDQRGHGRTTGWDDAYDAEPDPFRTLNMVRDALALLFALGHRSVAGVLGHDAGSPVAAWCALTRPDVFRSVVLMSAPFAGPPSLPFDVDHAAPPPRTPAANSAEIDAELAALDPPRKHYLRYYTTPGANAEMMNAPQGLREFIRAYYHYKSADWAGNRPRRLGSGAGAELAAMPTYYVMNRAEGMAATVAPFMPSPEEIAGCRWLSEAELEVYAQEYGRTGFQGGLQAYLRVLSARPDPEPFTHAGRTIDVPACFISGDRDWGTYQAPGSVEAMQTRACSDFRGVHIVEGAGHWVQQEQPDAVVAVTLRFLREAGR